MQEGIGRNGYRLLASFCFGLGLLGLLTTFYAFNQVKHDAGLYDWLGFVLTGISLVGVFILMLVVLGTRNPGVTSLPTAGTATFTRTVPAAPVAQPSIPVAAPDNNPNIEFDDAVPTQVNRPTNGPSTVVPARREIEPLPRQAPILPPNRNLAVDTKGWPQRRGPSGITRREMMEQLKSRQSGAMFDTDDADSTTQDEEPVPARAPNGSGKPIAVLSAKPPTILAKQANAESEARPGTTRGKCGGCGAILLAPSQRPVNLKCPRCDKVTLLA